MRVFLQKLGRVFGWMDAVEFAVPAVLAAVLLVGGPIAAIVHFLRARHYAAAVATAGLWTLAGICCIRDLRRRKFSAVTGIVLATWLIGALIIWWRVETL